MKVAAVALLAVALAAALLVPSAANAAAPDFAALQGTSPYIPLLTTEGDCSVAAGINALPAAEREAKLDQLRSWYTHFHADTANFFPLVPRDISPDPPLHLDNPDCRRAATETVAAGLARRGAVVSNYRNGSATSQAELGQMNFNEARDLETEAPLAIATFWPPDSVPGVAGDLASPQSRLAGAIDARTTTIRVTSYTGPKPPGLPASAIPTWPYRNSRGSGLLAGATSDSTRDFVSWIRVRNEVLQIVAEPTVAAGVVTLRVRRGAFGTAPAPAAAATQVFSPVYIGTGTTGDLAGSPLRDSPNAGLRYLLKIWKPSAHDWIAARISDTFGPGLGGHNSVWLDVSSCNLFNLTDPFGKEIFPWDDQIKSRMTADNWGDYQRVKVDALRQRLPGVQFTANAFRSPNDPCAEQLLATAYDGGSLEGWMKNGPAADWLPVMDYAFRISSNDWPAIYWLRWNRSINYTKDDAKLRRFSYGSLLLSYNAASRRFQYGGPWGLTKPDELFFWNWGAPTGTQPTDVRQLKVGAPTLKLYRRDFEKAITIVNASSQEVKDYPLGGTYYDVVRKTSTGRPAAVTSVTIGGGDAAFLLRSVP